MSQSPLVAGTVGMAAYADHHHLGMGFQTRQILLCRSTKLQYQELDRTLHHPHKRHGVRREDGITMHQPPLFQLMVGIVVHDIPAVGLHLLGHGAAHIEIVGF